MVKTEAQEFTSFGETTISPANLAPLWEAAAEVKLSLVSCQGMEDFDQTSMILRRLKRPLSRHHYHQILLGDNQVFAKFGGYDKLPLNCSIRPSLRLLEIPHLLIEDPQAPSLLDRLNRLDSAPIHWIVLAISWPNVERSSMVKAWQERGAATFYVDPASLPKTSIEEIRERVKKLIPDPNSVRPRVKNSDLPKATFD